jgi:hypothetical protein
MDISRRRSVAQAPEARSQRVAPRMGRRTKANMLIRGIPASLPGREKCFMTCSGGYASLHHRLHSAAPTGA